MYKNCKRSWIQIRRKEIITILFIILIEAIFISFNITNLSKLYRDQAKQILKEDATIINEIVKDYDTDSYQKVFKDLKTRFNIIDMEGQVLYDSVRYSEENQLDNHLDREEVQEAIDKGQGFSIRESATLGEVMAYYSMISHNKENETIIIRVSKRYAETMNQLREIILYQVLFFLFLNIMIHLFYKNYLKRDLYRKIEKIEKFLENGEGSKDIYLGGDKWLLKFWTVVKKWQNENLENIRRLDVEKRILNTIISRVDIAIVLMNENLEFILKNEKLQYLFEENKNSCVEGIKYIEIIKLIKHSQEKHGDLKEEIYIPSLKKYFLVDIKLLELNRQYLLTIKDITSSKELLEVQKKFISNVSHELKTPLTNIKGYLIALEDAPETLRANFFKTIMNNIEKLENIIGDFLNISKIESSNIINIVQIPIDRLKNTLSEALSGIINKKSAEITYNVNIKDSKGYINVDFEKIIPILKNLVENAIIYNKSQIPTIEISIFETPGFYKFIVKDNGMGIPQSDLDKIFDRFFRVDKARTSNVAGTGLGLAIVNELVKKCGGTISVISKEGEGSSFIFTILK